MQLVADVGGTNARLALGREGVLVAGSERRFAGDDHPGFDAVLDAYLTAAGRPLVDAVCVAVAGPVSGGTARLTNRAWDFSVDALRRRTGAAQAMLINDLTALGFATASTRPTVLRPGDPQRPRNGQALVVGAGTGFNVCALRRTPAGIVPLEAEEGHTALPVTVAARLESALGPGAAGAFPTTEETFAGRGLEALHARRTGQRVAGAALAEAAAAGEAEAAASLDLMAELLGLLLRELALRFLPREGLWLAGSVGRTLARRPERIAAGLLAGPFLREIPQAMPLLLIEDDMAALQGCLNAITR